MKKSMQIIGIVIATALIYSCIPVPVPVETGDSGYYGQPYGYGYEEPYGYDEQYGYGYDEYYDVPIVYDEPCYFTPPVSVTFVFDYFTYEVVNGYVDIVFWRDGRRHHRVPWYEHGRRITDRDIRAGRYHRVRGPELWRHREALREKHHITHPDSYYGIKKPGQQRVPKESRPQWENHQPRPIEQTPPWQKRQPSEMEQRQPSTMEHYPQTYEQKPSWESKPQRDVESVPPVVQRPSKPQPEGEALPPQRIEQKPTWQQRSPGVTDESPRMEKTMPPQRETTRQWGQGQGPSETSGRTTGIKQRYPQEGPKRIFEKRKIREKFRKPVRERNIEPKDAEKVREGMPKHEKEMNAAPEEFNKRTPR